MSKKSQASMEYLAIMGIVLLLFIPLTVIYFSYSAQAQDQIIDEQINNIGNKIISSSEEVFYYGNPAKTTININMPKKIEEIIITDYEINFRIRKSSGISDMAYISDIPIKGTIKNYQGKHTITIESKGDYVWLDG